MTIYDDANLGAVDEAARGLGFVQDVILKIAGDSATYPGQEGGIEPTHVPQLLERVGSLSHVRVPV